MTDPSSHSKSLVSHGLLGSILSFHLEPDSSRNVEKWDSKASMAPTRESPRKILDKHANFLRDRSLKRGKLLASEL